MIRAVRQGDVIQLVAEVAEMSIADVEAALARLDNTPGLAEAAPDATFHVTDPQLCRVLDASREVWARLMGGHE